MRTIRTKVYKFSELSKEAQQKVLSSEAFYNINVDYGSSWSEFVIEDFKEQAKDKGFDVEKVYFSGFSSQGDGAMFEGEVNDITKFTNDLNPHLKKAIANGLMDITWSVKHRGHYYHSNCSAINFDAGNYPGTYISGKGWQGNIQNEMDKLEETIEAAYHDICSELYRKLEKEYEYLTSEEAIKETIEANEYEFTKDGKQF